VASTLKSEASAQVVELLHAAEERCEDWAQNLALVNCGHDAATWGVLTQIIRLVEDQIKHFGHGSQQQREAMINLGRAGASLLGKLRAMNLPDGGLLRWTSELREATERAVLTTHGFETFLGCFTGWHQNRMAVEVISPTRLRFSAVPSLMDRRFRAHQQGRRIPGWPSTVDNPVDVSFVNDPDVSHLLENLCRRATLEGALAMCYPHDSELLSFLRDIHYKKLQRAFRRDPTLDLGGYNLAEFRQLFAALMSLCAVHEYVCDYWGKQCGRYPFESAVMVRSVSEWIRLLGELGNLPEDTTRQMLSDLTLGTTRPLDIYIHPFVPNCDSSTLFLIPHFIMNSRPEENVLRVCSYVRPTYHQAFANAKEDEMRDDIRSFCPDRYSVSGPLKLPDPLPDIDIVIKDSLSSRLLIGELKWLRKPTRIIDQADKGEELNDGFRQLRAIRMFLEQSPRYLKDRGIVEQEQDCRALSFAVIARDFLTYSQQNEDSWLTEFDALEWAVKNSRDLTECISKLQSFEWLPIEGRDFRIQFDPFTLEGVTIETEVIYPTAA
jgi:hypothetical protein